jgi:protein TonB
LAIAAGDRPALAASPAPSGLQRAAIIAGSLVLHGALFAALVRDPPATPPSVGQQVISIEIVVGADTAAGIASTPRETATEVVAPAKTVTEDSLPRDLLKPETPREAEREPPREPEVERVVPERVEATVATEAPAVIVAEAPAPAQTEVHPTEVKPIAAKPAEAKPTEAKPVETDKRKALRPHQAQSPTVASSGVGRGRSASDVAYQARVAAHLMRHKRFPEYARKQRQQGRAVVSFELDDAGRVTEVRLIQGTGHAALDREAEAMVHRASPFPPPPSGRTASFTAPVSFRLN